MKDPEIKLIINKLPQVNLNCIALFLRGPHFFRTCKAFNSISGNPQFWKKLILQDFYHLVTLSDLARYPESHWRNIYSVSFIYLRMVLLYISEKSNNEDSAQDLTVSTLKETLPLLPTKDYSNYPNWHLFILAETFRWQCDTKNLPEFIKLHTQAIENKPPLALSFIELACFRPLLTKEDPVKLIRTAFFVTHDPAIAFNLGILNKRQFRLSMVLTIKISFDKFEQSFWGINT